MAGYEVLGRIEGGRVRALDWPRSAVERALFVELGPATAVIEDQVRPLSEIVRERWRLLRDELSMMTFYLLDPDSWR